jgi:hypothetical protein
MRRGIWPGLLLLICLFASGLWWKVRVEAPMRAPRVVAETFDDFAYYYPMFSYGFEEVSQGRLPLWNPYQHCGTPFFATGQHLLLYPLNALYLLLPTAAAMKATNVLHIALAILFTYFLARSVDLRPEAALTAGLIFAFSPVVTDNIYVPHHLYGSIWIPLHLALVHRILTRERKARTALLLAVAVAAQYLGGYPQHCLFSAYVMGLYVLWFVAVEWHTISWGRLGSAVAALAGAALLAGFLALPQLLPAMELSALSPRPLGGMTLQTADPTAAPGWRLPLATLVGTLLPTWNSVFAAGIVPHVGAVGIALAVVGSVFPWRPRVAWFFAVLTLGSGVLALGRHTPLYELYFMLPTGDWFRGPTRFFVLTGFGLAMLAGCGVDSLGRGRVGRKGLLVLLGGALALAVMSSALLLSAGEQLAAIGSQLRDPAFLSGETSFAGRLAWLCGYAWAASAWLGAYLLWKTGRWFLVAALPLAAYAALFVSFANYARLPDTDPDLHTMPPSIVQYLRMHQGHHRTYVLPWGAMLPSRLLPPRRDAQPQPPRPLASKSGMMNRLYFVDDRENVYPVRFTEYVSRMVRPEDVERLEQVLARAGIPKDAGLPQGNFFVRADTPNLRLLDLLGARFIVEGPQTTFAQQQAPERFPLVFESDGVKVYRNAAELPRAFVVARAEIIAEPARVLDRLTSVDFDPMVSVILEERPAHPPADGSAPPRFEVQVVSYAPDEVVLDVRTSAPGFLVLTDQYYPGWRAEVDGAPAVIHRADYLFRAVPVDAGDHRVVFRYEPKWLRWGIAGASGAIALVVLGLVAEWRRHARRAAQPAAALSGA